MLFKPREHPDVRARKLNQLSEDVASAGDAAAHAAAALAARQAAEAAENAADQARLAALGHATSASNSAAAALAQANAANDAVDAAQIYANTANAAKALADQARADAQGAYAAADAAKQAALQAANDSAQSATSSLGSATSASGYATIVEQRASDVELYAASATAAANIAALKSDSANANANASSVFSTAAQVSATESEISAAAAYQSELNAAVSSGQSGASANAAAVSAASAAASQTAAGNSASAAQTSATNAATSAGNASSFASQASTSAGQASTSATNAAGSAASAGSFATNAANSAGVAGGHASASANSASIASAASTAAGNSASAAQAAQVAAEAANSNSQSAASAASASAASASSSAATATTASTLSATYRDQAQGHANSASSSASAASSSAASASASASTASTQASLSATHASAARDSMLATVPDNFNDPAAWLNWGNWGGSFAVSGGVGVTTNGGSFYSVATQPIAAGRRYRLTMRHRVTNVSAGTTYIGIIVLPYNSTVWFYTAASGPVGTWQTSSVEFTGDEVLATYSDATAVRLAGLLGYPNLADGEVSLFRIEDITSEYGAITQAGIANSQRVLAESARAEAETASSLSATYRDQSQGYANNANSSASAASSSAATASSAASAAETASTLSATYRDQALGHANNASSSASAASSSAASASSSAATATAQASLSSSFASSAQAAKIAADAIDGNLEFDRGFAGWSRNVAGGNPGELEGSNYIGVAWEGGNYFIVPPNNYAEVYSLKEFSIDPNRVYRISANYGAYFNGGTSRTSQVYIGFVGLDAAGNPVDHGAYGSWRYCVTFGTGGGPGIVQDGYRYTPSVIVTGTGNDSWNKFPPGTVKIKLMALLNYNGGVSTRDLHTYLGYIKIEDITESVNATTQANIANTQRTLAEAARAAAESASSLSATYRDQAQGHANNAASSASAANSSAVSASASAASAQSFTQLAASLATGHLNKNSGFDDYPLAGAGNLPINWNLDGNNSGSFYRVPDPQGGWAMRCPGLAGFQSFIANDMRWVKCVEDAGWYVWELDWIVNSGTNEGVGSYLVITNSSNTAIYSYILSAEAEVGVGSAGKTYSIRKLIQLSSGSNAYGFYLYAMAHWSVLGSIANTNDITFLKCGIRPATAAEIRDQTVLTPLQATVTTQGTAIADAQTKLAQARLRQVAAASGGTPALFELYSDNAGSSFAWLSAAQIRWGDNTIFDDATDTVTTTAGGSKFVQAMGAPFGVGGKMLQWVGPDTVALADMQRSNAYFYVAIDAPRIGGSGFPSGGNQVKDGPVNSTIEYLIPNGQGRTASAFYNTVGLPSSGSVTIQIRYREVGTTTWTNGGSDSDSGGAGDQLSAGVVTVSASNTSGVDKRYEFNVAITPVGSQTINHGTSFLKVE